MTTEEVLMFSATGVWINTVVQLTWFLTYLLMKDKDED